MVYRSWLNSCVKEKVGDRYFLCFVLYIKMLCAVKHVTSMKHKYEVVLHLQKGYYSI